MIAAAVMVPVLVVAFLVTNPVRFYVRWQARRQPPRTTVTVTITLDADAFRWSLERASANVEAWQRRLTALTSQMAEAQALMERLAKVMREARLRDAGGYKTRELL